ncbi:MAG TPA: excinuclease ABC subunit UvrA, partial [Candidatus Nitrosotalea sp.]|nr:excinuclease ABC subunit UvrA [Candidatus Nitrosotalea sp.]
TITEIYDYLRLLYARIGTPHCPKCSRKISNQSVESICESILKESDGKKILILASLVRRKKGTYEKLFEQVKKQGYSRIRVDGDIIELDGEFPVLDKQKWHNIEIVVDRVKASWEEKSRLYESIQTALKAGKGDVMVVDTEEKIFSQNNACPFCGISIGELEPRGFSFNSPFGACKTCHGLGVKMEFEPDLLIPDKTKSILDGAIVPWSGRFSSFRRQTLRDVGKKYGFDLMTPINKMSSKQLQVILYGSEEAVKFSYESQSTDSRWEYTNNFHGVIPSLQKNFAETDSESKREELSKFMRETPCNTCNGRRLKDEALAVSINSLSIMDTCDLSIDACYEFFKNLQLSETEKYIAKSILKEVLSRLEFLRNVGLNYLTLNRVSSTLSGGEAQRIRLATQIGSNLTGVLYVLDEPTIGLHQRDNAKLIKTLTKLRDLGNTILVVEHDEEVMRSSDWIIDLGPDAGVHGGNVVFEGTINEILKSEKSITGRYLKNHDAIKLDKEKHQQKGKLVLKGASENNLKNIDVEFPLGMMVTVTGVSGSGKSTLVNDILYKVLASEIYGSIDRPGKHKSITGMVEIDKVIGIDQSPIGRTPRSNPATYIGAFTPIRDLYAGTELSKERGYTPGQFSFNVADGRCFACEGDGVKKIEMQFLSDVYVVCDECKGKRYSSETLSVHYKDKNISDILAMTVEEALEFFANIPSIKRKL